MKKSVKVLIILLCLIIVGLCTYIIVDKLILSKGDKENKDSQISDANNIVNESEDDSKTNTSENTEGNKSENTDSEYKKISISDEDKLQVLFYLYNEEMEHTFSSIKDISSENIISSIIMGIWRGNIELESEREDRLYYSAAQIKNVAYSIYGCKLTNKDLEKSEFYKNGYFDILLGDGDPIPGAQYVKKESTPEGTVYTYSVFYSGNTGIYYYGERYETLIKDGIVIYSKDVSEKNIFDNSKYFKYDKENMENNVIIAVLNKGEKEFITEQKDGYYIYKNKSGKTAKVREITSVEVEDLGSESNGKFIESVAMSYIDSDGNSTHDGNYGNIIRFVLVHDKEMKNIEIYHMEYEDFEKSEEFKSIMGKNESNNKYDENGFLILKNSDVKDSDFYDVWYTAEPHTQLQINGNGIFVYDHMTKSSEVKGSFEINGTNIVFSNFDDGKKWSGQILMQEAGNKVLKIDKDNQVEILYNSEGD